MVAFCSPNDFLMFLNIFRYYFSILINVFHFEKVLWIVRTKHLNFSKILHLLNLFTMSIKLLVVILFIIKLSARNNVMKA